MTHKAKPSIADVPVLFKDVSADGRPIVVCVIWRLSAETIYRVFGLDKLRPILHGGTAAVLGCT